MKKFENLEKGTVNEVEEKQILKWKEMDILNKTIENRKDCENFVFYDGPAYANGFPGVHHMLAKILKDAVCKYKTMKGFKVDRKVGWDTHGLPTEVNVEKLLGFKDKKDIEEYGVEKFNAECKRNVRMNEKEFDNRNYSGTGFSKSYFNCNSCVHDYSADKKIESADRSGMLCY